MKKSGGQAWYRNPVPTVDVIIEVRTTSGEIGVVLIKRKNPPPGWALPGGFVDYGETLEKAAVREAREETCLKVELLGQFHTYSDPYRDPRIHTISTVFIGQARGIPKGADDASEAVVVDPQQIDLPLAFDHRHILDDYLEFKQGRSPWTRTKKNRPRRKNSLKT